MRVNAKIKKAKYLHLMFNDKFTKPFVDFLNRNFNTGEHLVLCKKIYEEFPFPKADNVVELKYFGRLKFNKAQKIICHSLYDNEVVEYLYNHKDILENNSYWFIYGGDSFDAPDCEKDNYVRGHFKGYISDTDGKCLIPMEKYNCTNARSFTACYNFPISKDMVKNANRNPHDYIQIQINNSCDKTILAVLDDLSKFKNENIKIMTILSYGMLEYKDEIIKKGKEIFGEKFGYVDTYLSADKYTQHLAQNDIMILNQNREQGFGNTIVSIALGIKLFVKSEISTYSHYNSKGITVYDTNSIKNMNFSDFIAYPPEIKNNNIKKIDMYYDENYIKDLWMKVFDD